MMQGSRRVEVENFQLTLPPGATDIRFTDPLVVDGTHKVLVSVHWRDRKGDHQTYIPLWSLQMDYSPEQLQPLLDLLQTNNAEIMARSGNVRTTKPVQKDQEIFVPYGGTFRILKDPAPDPSILSLARAQHVGTLYDERGRLRRNVWGFDLNLSDEEPSDDSSDDPSDDD
jgi:hypothetical protein